MNLLIAFIAFDIIVIVHELGHFIAARLTGIKVLEFSLFIGPKIFSIQRGETMYSLRVIPALAYVRMEGEEEASDDERAFSKRPIWARFITVFSGPAASILLGVVFLAVSYLIAGVDTTKLSDVPVGSPAHNAGLRAGDKIISYNNNSVYQPLDVSMFMYASKGKPVPVTYKRGDSTFTKTVIPDIIHENRNLVGFMPKAQYGPESNIVNTVEKGTAADKGNLKPGDQIIKIDNTQITSLHDISNYLYENKGKTIDITVKRDGTEQVLRGITPAPGKNPEQYDIGMIFTNEKGNIFSSLKSAFVNSYSITRIGVLSIVWLINGQVPLNQMAGPVGIVSSINTVVEHSPSLLDILLNLLNISALISIGLGVTNLIPIPPTDGSKIILLGVEAIRRKPIPIEKEAKISMVGFAIFFGLFILLTYNDIARLITGG